MDLTNESYYDQYIGFNSYTYIDNYYFTSSFDYESGPNEQKTFSGQGWRRLGIGDFAVELRYINSSASTRGKYSHFQVRVGYNVVVFAICEMSDLFEQANVYGPNQLCERLVSFLWGDLGESLADFKQIIQSQSGRKKSNLAAGLENLLNKFGSKAQQPKFICGRYFTPGFAEDPNSNTLLIFNHDIDCFFYNTRQHRYWDMASHAKNLYGDSALRFWRFDSKETEGLLIATSGLPYGKVADGYPTTRPLLAEEDPAYLAALATHIWGMHLTQQPFDGTLFQLRPVAPVPTTVEKTKVRHWRSLRIGPETIPAQPQPYPTQVDYPPLKVAAPPPLANPLPAPSLTSGISGNSPTPPTGQPVRKSVNFSAVTGSRSLDLPELSNNSEPVQTTKAAEEETDPTPMTEDNKSAPSLSKPDNGPDQPAGTQSKYWLG